MQFPIDSLTLDPVYFIPNSPEKNPAPAKKEPAKAPSFGNRLISTISPFGQGIATKVTGLFSAFWKPATPTPVSPYSHFMCGCGCEESAERPQERTVTQLLVPTNPCFLSGLVDRSEPPAQIPPQASSVAQPLLEQAPSSQNYRVISRLRDVRYLSDAAFYNRSLTSETLKAVPKPEEFEKITAATHTTDNIVYLSRVVGYPYAGIHARAEEDFGEFESFQSDQEERTEEIAIRLESSVSESPSPVSPRSEGSLSPVVSDDESERGQSPAQQEQVVQLLVQERQSPPATPRSSAESVESPTRRSRDRMDVQFGRNIPQRNRMYRPIGGLFF